MSPPPRGLHRARKFIQSCLFALATCLAVPAAATMVRALELDELTTQAELIAIAEVLSVSSHWDRGGRNIYTRVELSLAETWKGAPPASGRIVLAQPGGVVGDIEMKVHGLAEFRTGERALLFLRGNPGAARVVGMAQGLRPLRFDVSAARWMVDGADHSAVYRPEARGGYRPAAPAPSEALDDLRTRVRNLVQR